MKAMYANGIEYLTAHVKRHRTFSAPGHQSGPTRHNCTRGILPREVARYPELDGKVFAFDFTLDGSRVTNPRLVTQAEAAALS